MAIGQGPIWSVFLISSGGKSFNGSCKTLDAFLNVSFPLAGPPFFSLYHCIPPMKYWIQYTELHGSVRQILKK
ncbi:hypothetical protein B2G51_13275 [Leptospira santarosai]|nr:hypothetical protein B2G51_13275 [Leptospira santarosai]